MAAREKTLVAALAVLSFALGVMAGSILLSRGDAPDVAAGPQSIDTEQPHGDADLIERLRVLYRQFDQLVTDVSSMSRTDPPPSDMDERLEDMSERLEAYETSSQSLEQAIMNQEWVTTPPTLEQLRNASPEPRWTEIEPLRELYGQDRRHAARRSVQFLTYEEILFRFGRPTTISPKGAWYYTRPGKDGVRGYTMQLTFLGEYMRGIQFS